MIDLEPASRRMIELLAGVTDDQLAGPTPCAAFTVGGLIDHVDQASQQFAALAGYRPPEPVGDSGPAGDGSPRPARFGPGWRDQVGGHVRALAVAWDDPVAWQGSTGAGDVELSNERWGMIALTELVVHGWDLARGTGQPFALPDDTLRACLDHVAEFVPEAPFPDLWGPPVDVAADASVLDQIVAITGRTP
ncbi:MAG TPA: TIGR03086 family metal-binding protein [Acidimicrobiales bacterium]|nr:TIGR03086 family metal-binding protein [Acidimicrobiales bacterium]